MPTPRSIGFLILCIAMASCADKSQTPYERLYSAQVLTDLPLACKTLSPVHLKVNLYSGSGVGLACGEDAWQRFKALGRDLSASAKDSETQVLIRRSAIGMNYSSCYIVHNCHYIFTVSGEGHDELTIHLPQSWLNDPRNFRIPVKIVVMKSAEQTESLKWWW